MLLRDLAERTVWTFIQAFLGTLAVDQFVMDGDLGALRAALAAALAAVAAVIKGFAASRTGDGTASTVRLDVSTHPGEM